MEFKVGQRVRYIGTNPKMANKVGTIIDTDDFFEDAVVDFDNYPSYKDIYAPLLKNLKPLSVINMSKFYKNY